MAAEPGDYANASLVPRVRRTERWTKAGPVVSGMPEAQVLELGEQAGGVGR